MSQPIQHCTTTTITRHTTTVQPELVTITCTSGGQVPTVCQVQQTVQGTPLKLDTWYHIVLQSGGIATWSNDKLGGQLHYIQIVYDSEAKWYSAGEKWYYDSQWKVVESEVPGYYQFINRAQPNSVVTWGGGSASGKFVALYIDGNKDHDYLPGGKYRDDCLWKIEAGEGIAGTYAIYNKRYQPSGGIVTYASQDIGPNRKYVQFYTSDTQAAYKRDPDYLWNFLEIKS